MSEIEILRTALMSMIEKTEDLALLKALMNVYTGGQTQEKIPDKKKRKGGKSRLNIPGLATLITEYLEKNGPSTAETIFEKLREVGQLDQNKELAHVEFQLKKQTGTYVLLPNGKWWLKNKKLGVVA